MGGVARRSSAPELNRGEGCRPLLPASKSLSLAVTESKRSPDTTHTKPAQNADLVRVTTAALARVSARNVRLRASFLIFSVTRGISRVGPRWCAHAGGGCHRGPSEGSSRRGPAAVMLR
jgi:hypothetical protein